MKQHVKFAVAPTENPDGVVGHARYVSNSSNGIGMDVLAGIVEKYIPFVNNDQVVTHKEIIRTDRYECPCCNTSLTALVRVYCTGLMTPEWDEVSGLYEVSIEPAHGACEVTVMKLEGRTIHAGRTPYLPRKDYKADPKAREEIEEREAFLVDLARENPDNVLLVGGIETSDDLANLVKMATGTK